MALGKEKGPVLSPSEVDWHPACVVGEAFHIPPPDWKETDAKRHAALMERFNATGKTE